MPLLRVCHFSLLFACVLARVAFRLLLYLLIQTEPLRVVWLSCWAFIELNKFNCRLKDIRLHHWQFVRDHFLVMDIWSNCPGRVSWKFDQRTRHDACRGKSSSRLQHESEWRSGLLATEDAGTGLVVYSMVAGGRYELWFTWCCCCVVGQTSQLTGQKMANNQKQRSDARLSVLAVMALGSSATFMAFITPNWLASDSRRYGSEFSNLGLWETCYRSLRGPEDDIFIRFFVGCRWIFREEYPGIHTFLLPGE